MHFAFRQKNPAPPLGVNAAPWSSFEKSPSETLHAKRGLIHHR